MDTFLIYLIPATGALALLYAYLQTSSPSKPTIKSDKTTSENNRLADGILTFLKAHGITFAIFSTVLAFALAVTADTETSSWTISLTFIFGILCSAIAAFAGWEHSKEFEYSNFEERPSNIVRRIKKASKIGFYIIGSGIFGLGLTLVIFATFWGLQDATLVNKAISMLAGFLLGGLFITLWFQTSGNIFNNGSNLGNQLIANLTSGIPDNIFLNPSTVAARTGNFLHRITGMGSDLLGSYLGSVVGAMVLGVAFMTNPEWMDDVNGLSAVLLPMLLAGIGIITSIMGIIVIHKKKFKTSKAALATGKYLAAAIMLVGSWIIIHWILPQNWTFGGIGYTPHGVFLSMLFGVAADLLINHFSAYFSQNPTFLQAANQNKSGNKFLFSELTGLKQNLLSTLIPVIILATTIIAAYEMAGLYGISIAAVGLISNSGIQLTTHTFEAFTTYQINHADQTEQDDDQAVIHFSQPADLNSSAAFSVSASALSSITLFSAFITSYNAAKESPLTGIDITQPTVLAALLIGAALPFLFSAISLQTIQKVAKSIFEETKRQFSSVPELQAIQEAIIHHDQTNIDNWSKKEPNLFKKAKNSDQPENCISSAATVSNRYLLPLAIFIIVIPILFGFIGGAELLGGLLIGVIVSGILMSLFLSNITTPHHHPNQHADTRSGLDLSSNPFNYISGRPINALMKLMSVLALVIATMI